MAKYRIVKDDDTPPIYQAQKYNDGDWFYVHGTTSFSKDKTESLLKIKVAEQSNVVKELEL